MNDVITLVSTTAESNIYGDPVETVVSRREVFADVRSVGQTEFYQAALTGLKPEVKFVLADYYDYEGEKTVEWDGVRYTVERTYRDEKRHSMELTCTSEVNPDERT